MSEIRSFKDLRVWQAGMELAETIYEVTAGFPPEERFGLTAQIRRCAVSVPSNIAEGHGRGSTGDYLRFLSIASGSRAELETQLILSSRFGYLGESDFDRVIDQIESVGRMLNALKASLSRLR